ncbi:MAG: site-2 protease family protein [Phycisphaerae bacterium]|jgi:Zn-dependent protease
MIACPSFSAPALPLALMSLQTILDLLPGFVIGLTLHECAHAWSASLLGDDFPRRQGRVSLNPFRHLSPLGTLALLLLPFGWAKPVVVNVYNFRRPKWDYLWTSLAGPAANVLVVLACLALMHLTRHTYAFGPRGEYWMARADFMLLMAIIINTILAAFNLLPVPPLDGSKIWPLLLGRRIAAGGKKFSWVYIVVLIVLLRGGTVNTVLNALVDKVAAVAPMNDYTLVSIKHDQGCAAIDRGDFAGAEKIYDQILAITGDMPIYRNFRGYCRAAQGNTAGAMADYTRVMELHPDAETAKRVTEAMQKLQIPREKTPQGSGQKGPSSTSSPSTAPQSASVDF